PFNQGKQGKGSAGHGGAGDGNRTRMASLEGCAHSAVSGVDLRSGPGREYPLLTVVDRSNGTLVAHAVCGPTVRGRAIRYLVVSAVDHAISLCRGWWDVFRGHQLQVGKASQVPCGRMSSQLCGSILEVAASCRSCLICSIGVAQIGKRSLARYVASRVSR